MNPTPTAVHELRHGESISSRRTDGLLALAATLWRRRLLVLLVVGLVLGVVAIGLATAERTYTAQARVAVVPGETGPSGTEYEAMQRTIADIAVSRPVLSRVQERLDDRTLADLREQVDSGAVTGTLLVQVSVTDTDPVRAAEIANAVTGLLPLNDPSNRTIRYEITEPASVPQTTASPNVPISVLAGSALALGLAVAIAVAYDRIARTVDSAEELAASGTRVLALVGPAPETDGLEALDPGTERFADLRALRVALEFASTDKHTRSLVVAGAARTADNGWLAVNLAAALAGVGHKVLLVDADRSAVERPAVLSVPEARGLYDVLAGDLTLEEAIIEGPTDGVDVVTLGTADQAASSLLEMRFRRLMATSDETGDEDDLPHDIVVVNAPPVTESDDARIMAVGGGLLLTVPVGAVKPTVLEGAIAALRSGRTRLLGAVLMGVR